MLQSATRVFIFFNLIIVMLASCALFVMSVYARKTFLTVDTHETAVEEQVLTNYKRTTHLLSFLSIMATVCLLLYGSILLMLFIAYIKNPRMINVSLMRIVINIQAVFALVIEVAIVLTSIFIYKDLANFYLEDEDHNKTIARVQREIISIIALAGGLFVITVGLMIKMKAAYRVDMYDNTRDTELQKLRNDEYIELDDMKPEFSNKKVAYRVDTYDNTRYKDLQTIPNDENIELDEMKPEFSNKKLELDLPEMPESPSNEKPEEPEPEPNNEGLNLDESEPNKQLPWQESQLDDVNNYEPTNQTSSVRSNQSNPTGDVT